SLNFGSQAVNTPSTAQTVVLTNVGNDVLNISSITASGDFAVSPQGTTCPASGSLGAGASCNIGVVFTPTTTGTRTGALTISDNTGDSPQSVLLNGAGTPSGPAITLSPTALPFGDQMVGTTSGALTVTVTNPGNATLTFISIKASGDFAETD